MGRRGKPYPSVAQNPEAGGAPAVLGFAHLVRVPKEARCPVLWSSQCL